MALNVSAKVNYACLAMLELANQHADGKPVQIRRLAEAHRIPAQFLVQILLQLKAAGLVCSTRGACGGYRLSQSPDSISIGDIVRAIEGASNDESFDDIAGNPTSAALQQLFRQLDHVVWEAFDTTCLQDLVERVSGRSEPMYYI